jgi:L-fuconolactonase
VQDESDPQWVLRGDVIRGLQEVARRGLPYDLLVRPHHLPLLPELARRVSALRMVIDHLAKPPIAAREIQPWARGMEAAAALPQVCCKLSGMITEANWESWSPADLKPYVDHVYRLFGPDRLLFGSDWPVCLTAGTWKEVLAAFTQTLGPLPMEVRSKLLGETAANFYGLG